MMSTTAAILYQKAGFDTATHRLMGRQAASEGFLKAMSSYSTAEHLYCYTHTRTEFEEFCQRVQPWLRRSRSIRWVAADYPATLTEPGVLYRPDPLIAQLAWQRRYRDQRAYSLCGVTHTLASKDVMAGIGDLLIAPVQPWDAVICTSKAVKTMAERILSDWSEYLAQRLGAAPTIPIQLPVIPLGVDCDSFPQDQHAQHLRQQLRQRFGIGPDDLVVLFVGRLIFHAKAHPVPMYLAVERAAQTTSQKVHLLQAGWFEDAQQEMAFKQAASTFCPSVNHIMVDGRQPDVRQTIWSVADLFISLADNIQETFGLTPIEAMAAGLPVVVSDWNGYQETVRHGVDGFRISTYMPPPGHGLDLAALYQGDRLNYSTYVGYASQMTAVDVEACTQALTTLFHQPELRQRMGKNGRRRAQDTYDWRVIIPAYEALWQELANLRMASLEVPPSTQSFHPLCSDPFQSLSHYPTQSLNPDHILTIGRMAEPDHLQQIRDNWMTNFGTDRRVPTVIIDQVLAAIAEAGALAVAEILQRFGGAGASTQIYLYRTLVYLLKFDIVRVQHTTPPFEYGGD